MLNLLLGINLVLQFLGILEYKKYSFESTQRKKSFPTSTFQLKYYKKMKQRAFRVIIFGVFAILYFQIKDLTDDK